MKKILFLLCCLFSVNIYAYSKVSVFLKSIPEQCYAEDIIDEISVINVPEPDYILEVIDVKDVKTLTKTNNKLVCKVSFITEKYSKTSKVTFTKNSIGKIVVSY